MMQLLGSTVIVLGNVWIWQLLTDHLLVASLTIVTTSLLFQVIRAARVHKHYRIVWAIAFSLLLIFQWQTTHRELNDLPKLDNDHQRVQQLRLKQYPPVYISIGQRTKWFPVGEWFETRPESIILQKLTRNLAELVDPNFYFFANHPRETVGIPQTDKFPFIFLPLFVYGLLSYIKALKKKSDSTKLIFTSGFILPISLISIIGHDNLLGPFSLFPFIVAYTYYGLLTITQQLINKYRQ
jgi:hypothetical protein